MNWSVEKMNFNYAYCLILITSFHSIFIYTLYIIFYNDSYCNFSIVYVSKCNSLILISSSCKTLIFPSKYTISDATYLQILMAKLSSCEVTWNRNVSIINNYYGNFYNIIWMVYEWILSLVIFYIMVAVSWMTQVLYGIVNICVVRI